MEAKGRLSRADAVAQRLVAVERDRAKKFLALGVAGVVRAGVGLLRGEIDLAADAL